MIKKKNVGTLRAIARREGGIKKDGKVSKEWARKKLKRKGTTERTKKKIIFFLNMNKK